MEGKQPGADTPKAMRLGTVARRYRLIIVVFLTSFCAVLFTYFTYTSLSDILIKNITFLAGLPGDFPLYVLRYCLSFLLLGIIPLLTAASLGWDRKQLGLIFPKVKYRWLIPFFFIVPVLLGILSSFSEELAAFYPHSRTLLDLKNQHGYSPLLLHHGAHLFLYYLPWEFFFRGLLIVPFIDAIEKTVDKQQNPAVFPLLLGIASLQTVPSALLHFGHPISETLSAVLFGVFSAYLVVRTKSIFPGLLVHTLIGMSLDTMIYIRF